VVVFFFVVVVAVFESWSFENACPIVVDVVVGHDVVIAMIVRTGHNSIPSKGRICICGSGE
jgi:hypothetical protein